MALDSYSTFNAGSGPKLGYWNDLSARLFVPADLRAAYPDRFEASLRLGELGPVSMAEQSMSPAVVQHTAAHVARTRDRWFALVMPVAGRMQIRQYGRDVALGASDFALIDTVAPLRISLLERTTSITLRLAPRTLQRYMPNPEMFCGLRMAGNQKLGCVLRDLLPNLWRQVGEGFSETFAESLANNLLDVVATYYAMEHRASVDDSAIKSTRKTQVKRFVEARLQDSDLAVGSIALSMQISARHLHRIFSDEEEGLGEYILRRRLEECARRFRTPLWQSRTITEIAMDWGFSSMAHFSRAFKARFGVSPTDFRRAHAPSKKKYNDVSTASGGLSNGLILRALSRNN